MYVIINLLYFLYTQGKEVWIIKMASKVDHKDFVGEN